MEMTRFSCSRKRKVFLAPLIVGGESDIVAVARQVDLKENNFIRIMRQEIHGM